MAFLANKEVVTKASNFFYFFFFFKLFPSFNQPSTPLKFSPAMKGNPQKGISNTSSWWDQIDTF